MSSHTFFEGDAGTNENMAGDFAAEANFAVGLDFDEGAVAGFRPDGAAVKIHRVGLMNVRLAQMV